MIFMKYEFLKISEIPVSLLKEFFCDLFCRLAVLEIRRVLFFCQTWRR